MGVFDKVNDQQVKEAQYYERGNYVRPGRYLVEILRCKEGFMRPPKGTGFYVVEMRVHETSDSKNHPLKSTMTWMSTADKDAFLGNVKHFVGAAAQIPEPDVTVDDLRSSVSEENPLAGLWMQVDAINIKTLADKDFTKVKFTFVSDGPPAAEAAAQ